MRSKGIDPAQQEGPQSGQRAAIRYGKRALVPLRIEDRRLVRELLRGRGTAVQAKVRVGEPDDELELQADRSSHKARPVADAHAVVADRVY